MRKPKPATAGERLQMKMQNVKLHELRTLDQLYEYRNAAAMEDRAIARAVRKERNRCIACLQVDGLAIPLSLLDGSNP